MATEMVYIPPEIEGSVPENVQSKADEALNDGNVWKVEVKQNFLKPQTNESKYTVTAYFRKGSVPAMEYGPCKDIFTS